MTDEQRKSTHGLHLQMFSDAHASLSLAQEISAELINVTFYGMSMGDENLLQRAGVYISRERAQFRFNKLRRKVATYIGKRKALIEIGNRYLSTRGMEVVAMQADYGLSGCKADTDTGFSNTDWDERMSDAYERMQLSIEAVEADISRCQDLLLALPA